MASLQLKTLPEKTWSHRRMSLMALAQRIVELGDREAVRELHERRLFRNSRGQRVRMTDFLLELTGSDLAFRWCGRDPVVTDQAYDLTLAKFHGLPANPRGPRSAVPSDGPDCRYYYRALYTHLVKEFQQRPPTSVIDAELRAEGAFQRMLVRHFFLSSLECKRRAAKTVRRYTWKSKGNTLVLQLPVEMTGSYCRTWLQEHIPDVDTSRPGERDRVQAIIDRLLARRRILSLDRLCGPGERIRAGSAGAPSTLEEQTTVAGLAAVVAEEKAENIDDQRPAIRGLGREKLKELIRTVFESLGREDYRAERIAAAFKLSNSSMSRFAGCQWKRDGGTSRGTEVPDLWRNTAHILANHEDFVAVARGAGVWGRVCQVAGEAGHGKGDTE